MNTKVTREERLQVALEYLMENVEQPPERNCACHISPPCSDCVDHGGLREAFAMAHAAIGMPPGFDAYGEAGTVLRSIMEELGRAVAKFPTWPTDPLHAQAVVGEEAGELNKAVLQAVYEPHKSTPEDAAAEAVQTAAMAIRFLMSMPRYQWTPGAQHRQGGGVQDGDT